MPPEPVSIDPSGARPFIDPYGRAKTVRIGKWRWPPPKADAEQGDSFLEFKMRQHQRKSNQHQNSRVSVKFHIVLYKRTARVFLTGLRKKK